MRPINLVAVSSTVFFNLLLACRQAHPLGRLCFGSGFFAAILFIDHDILLLLAALAVSMLLLRCMHATWKPLIRAARLLMWLFIPIVTLHLIFTPGQLIWPDSDIPFTQEGLYEGVWLALRLCALFYAAMLLSGSLGREEWALYCLRLPLIGARLLPYVKLALPMRALVSRKMAEAKQQMPGVEGLSSFPRMLNALTALFTGVWHGSAAEARLVWDGWDDAAGAYQAHGEVTPGLLLTLIGLLMPIAVWMI